MWTLEHYVQTHIHIYIINLYIITTCPCSTMFRPIIAYISCYLLTDYFSKYLTVFNFFTGRFPIIISFASALVPPTNLSNQGSGGNSDHSRCLSRNSIAEAAAAVAPSVVNISFVQGVNVTAVDVVKLITCFTSYFSKSATISCRNSMGAN
jgi:hypothetical protein